MKIAKTLKEAIEFIKENPSQDHFVDAHFSQSMSYGEATDNSCELADHWSEMFNIIIKSIEGAIEVKASFDKETGLMLFPIYPKSYYDNHVSLTDRIEFRDILIIEKPKTEIPEKKCNHDLKFRYVDGHKLCEECGLEFGF
jgi:hypothetical protein